MRKIFLALCLTIGTIISTQAQTVTYMETNIGSVEKLPTYVGGIKALQNDLARDLVTDNLGERKSGKVTIHFMVDATGNAYDFKILNGFDEKYDELALAAVKKAKQWRPGAFGNTPRIMGQKVQVVF
jgi:TonB family protein